MKLYYNLSALLFFISLHSMEQPSLNPTSFENLILNVTNKQLVEQALRDTKVSSFDIAKSATITLETDDHVQFQVPLYIAEQLLTVKRCINDIPNLVDELIPLFNIKGVYLEQIINALQKISTLKHSNNYTQDLVDTLNKLFNSKKLQDIIELLRSANYLDNQLLLNYFAALIAAYISQTDNKENIAIVEQCSLLPSELQQLISKTLQLLNRRKIDEFIANNSKVLKSHTNSIYLVAFSTDGKLVLTGHEDGTAIIWDVNTGTIIHVLNGHSGQITSIAFSLDNKLALTGSWDHRAILWDVDTGTVIHELEGHAEIINSVAFSPNGKLALTGSNDGTAILWNVDTGKIIRNLKGHYSPITSVAFSSDSKLALTGSEDGTVIVWSIDTGTIIHMLKGHTHSITSVALNPAGKLALTGSEDGTVILWDLTVVDNLTLPELVVLIKNKTALSEEKEQINTQRFNTGNIVLSFLVGFLATWELLQWVTYKQRAINP